MPPANTPKCDGQRDGAACNGSASVTTKSGLHLCRDCAVEYGGDFATPQDENRVRWFRDSLYDSDDGT
ncbi:hypothetical protein MTBLM1_30370 [Rhodospirillaceae bacterium LM-1]|nr:hypothetical protein MTBLM1_30370 [Rhodospirillaceae bacterium LM-1]